MPELRSVCFLVLRDERLNRPIVTRARAPRHQVLDGAEVLGPSAMAKRERETLAANKVLKRIRARSERALNSRPN